MGASEVPGVSGRVRSKAPLSRLNAPRTWNRAGVLHDQANRMREFVTKYVEAGARVIDYGCGDMPYRPLFEAAGARYIGCDLDGDCDVHFPLDGVVPVPAAQADVVLSNQVLEHVWAVGNYLSEAHRLLRSGGILCLTTHGMWWYHAHPDDFFRWTRAGLERILVEAGFELVETVPIMNILNFSNFVWAEILGRLLSRIPVLGNLLTGALNVLLFWSYPIIERVVPTRLSRDNSAVYMVVARKPARQAPHVSGNDNA